MKTPLNYDKYKEYLESEDFKRMFSEDNYHYIFKFENNYGASVIKHYGSYGYEEDLFELAVLFFDENGKSHLSYNTPITDDVVGYLTNDEVIEYLGKIKNYHKE